MFYSQKELLQEIALGESALLEFEEVRFRGDKVSGPSWDKLADGLAAFANSRAGSSSSAWRTRPMRSSIVNSLSLDSLRYRQATRNDAITSLLLIWLEPVRLQRSGGFSPAGINRVSNLVEEHREEIVEAWHGHFVT